MTLVEKEAQAAQDLFAHEVQTIDGQQSSLEEYRGQVLLIVNTASACGFTNQLDGLESLWRDYHEQGLSVLGFPCNQFGGQDPASDGEIAQFCRLNHNVSFPIFSKIEVNGPKAHPLYVQLRKEARGLLGSSIKWNFTKFIVGRDGTVERFAPMTKPENLRAEIELRLQAPLPTTCQEGVSSHGNSE